MQQRCTARNYCLDVQIVIFMEESLDLCRYHFSKQTLYWYRNHCIPKAINIHIHIYILCTYIRMIVFGIKIIFGAATPRSRHRAMSKNVARQKYMYRIRKCFKVPWRAAKGRKEETTGSWRKLQGREPKGCQKDNKTHPKGTSEQKLCGTVAKQLEKGCEKDANVCRRGANNRCQKVPKTNAKPCS